VQQVPLYVIDCGTSRAPSLMAVVERFVPRTGNLD